MGDATGLPHRSLRLVSTQTGVPSCSDAMGLPCGGLEHGRPRRTAVRNDRACTETSETCTESSDLYKNGLPIAVVP
jgi:hypothetical protein